MQPAHRRITPSILTITIVALGVGGWIAYRTLTNGPDLRVEVADVSGYTANQPVWLPFTLTLRLMNAGNQSITIRRIDVEPDLDDFNEAYGRDSPYNLSPPILLNPAVGRSHVTSVTVLNANQLPERTYRLVFTIRLQTDAGEIIRQFATQFTYSRIPAQRKLRLGA